MNTLLNILFGFFILMFSGVAITLVGGWLVLQLFGNKEKDDCGCNSCDCDDDLIPMLDRPLTKEELKEVNMKPKINDFSKKTKITGMGGHQMKNSDRFKNMKPREENDPNPNQK
tara:strand:+ start:445 stop:786 length:342 start_codon:yes stop_codon:yes gene_type:complete